VSPSSSVATPRVTAAAILFLWPLACGDDTLAPGEELVFHSESANFLYFASPGDGVDADYQERHYAWAMERLNLVFQEKIEFHKYRDRDHMQQVTGARTNGFAEPDRGRFHTIWPLDNHEYIHVVFSRLVGDPPALFSEGVAVAHHGASISGDFIGDPLWNGSSAHIQVQRMIRSGTLPDLRDMAVNGRFRQLDDQTTYPIAGSFVRFLIDHSTIGKFKSFAAICERGSSFRDIQDHFQVVFGESLESLWQQWQAFLLAR
jgi:hypothetical protein